MSQLARRPPTTNLQSKGRDIQDRALRFGVRIVTLASRFPRTVAGYELARQLIRSGISVGANTQEADAAESAIDFVHKMKIALKEAQETRFWLRIIMESNLLCDDETRALLQESDELVRIINTIVAHTRTR